MNKRRRRKLHRGEFTEYGFSVSWRFGPRIQETPSDEDHLRDGDQARQAFWDAFLLFLLAQDLTFGGGDDGQTGSGFVCQALRGSPTEAQRRSVTEWLRQQENEGTIASVVIGEMSDAWHGPERQYLQCLHWLIREQSRSSETALSGTSPLEFFATMNVIIPSPRGADAARLERRKRRRSSGNTSAEDAPV